VLLLKFTNSPSFRHAEVYVTTLLTECWEYSPLVVVFLKIDDKTHLVNSPRKQHSKIHIVLYRNSGNPACLFVNFYAKGLQQLTARLLYARKRENHVLHMKFKIEIMF